MMNLLTRTIVIGALMVFVAPATFARTPAPSDAEVYIISPQDGDTVTSPVTVKFGLRGMGVAPAGVDTPNTGHHHLLIDTGPPALNAPIPADDNHKHFGGGQTETVIELAPGKHTLQLIMGDKLHFPHEPPVMSRKITITVK
ncbi:MAG: DUF4399 domain-containing protein [Betaproteobacteria bacterium]|nr:MAG: DUF4399 domain-containing protein [Betaproteobacteria bacterium]